jgi:hypothetical protein
VGAVEAVGFSLGPEPQAVASITAEGNKATELNAHATLKADNMKHDENGQVHTLHSIGVSEAVCKPLKMAETCNLHQSPRRLGGACTAA